MTTVPTPRPEQVEAAARAFHQELFAEFGSGTDWRDYEHEARAALAAALPLARAEWTEVAIEAIYADCDDMTEEYGACSDCERIADVLTAILDAPLQRRCRDAHRPE